MIRKLTIAVLLAILFVPFCFACLPEPGKIIRLQVLRCVCGGKQPVNELEVTLDKIGGRGGDLFETKTTGSDGWVQFGTGKLGDWIITGTYTLSTVVNGKKYSLTISIDCSQTVWEYELTIPKRTYRRWQRFRN